MRVGLLGSEFVERLAAAVQPWVKYGMSSSDAVRAVLRAAKGPTEDMCAAGMVAVDPSDCWDDMIDEALKDPEEEEDLS